MNTESHYYDVLVIGSGVAGLSAAIKLSEVQHLKIAVVTRAREPEESNTYWAQGGLVYSDQDDKELFGDIQKASSNTSYDKAINFFIQHSKEIVDEILLEKSRTEFKRDEDASLSFTQEAAHSIPRIIFHGDHTGKSIEVSLLNYLKGKSNVEILAAHTAIDLITPSHHGVNIVQKYEPNLVVGAYIFDQSRKVVKKLMAKKTVLATGGMGALYLHHTNSEGARGDGHAMARRAGATLANMGFIQFHPTTFYGSASHRRFLISEAVRGEGGKLVDPNGVQFMNKYHPDGELAPRDVVSSSIINEMINNKWDCVYLDIRHKEKFWLQTRFPSIFKYLENNQIDMSTNLIPVVPAAHYSCGGIKTDLKGKTNLEGLYAVGEVACTGLHGTNRLASTSLAEGLTWGYKAAENILHELESIKDFYSADFIKNWFSGSSELDLALISQDKMIIKQFMWNYVGINKSRNRLMRARAMFSELYEQVQKFYKNAELHDELIGLRNSIEVAFLVLSDSLKVPGDF